MTMARRVAGDQLGQHDLLGILEVIPQRRFDPVFSGELYLQGVDVTSILVHLEVQMRSGASARAPDVADDLALFHPVASTQSRCIAVKMGVTARIN